MGQLSPSSHFSIYSSINPPLYSYIYTTPLTISPAIDPVRKVKISGKETGKRGQTITLTCKSSVSYPPAILQWDLSSQQLKQPPVTTAKAEQYVSRLCFIGDY